MTNKEKMRIAWEQGREIEVKHNSSGKVYRGRVECYGTGGLRFRTDGGQEFGFKWWSMNTIRFLDEEGEYTEIDALPDPGELNCHKDSSPDDGDNDKAFRFVGGKSVKKAVYKMIEEAIEPLREKLNIVIQLESVTHVEAGKVVCEPDDDTQFKDEPADIAKERWWVNAGGRENANISRVVSVVHGDPILFFRDSEFATSEARIQLMIAAPEIADLARELLRETHPVGCEQVKAFRALFGKLVGLGISIYTDADRESQNDTDGTSDNSNS